MSEAANAAPASQAIQVQEQPVRQRVQYTPVASAMGIMDTARFEHLGRVAQVMARAGLMPMTLTHVKQGSGDNAPMIELPYEVIVARAYLIANQADLWNADPNAVAQCTSIVHGKLMYEGKLVHGIISAKLGVDLVYEFGRYDATARDIKGRRDEETGEWFGDMPGPDDQALGVRVLGTLPGEVRPRWIAGSVHMWHKGAKSPWGAITAWPRQLRYMGAREWCRAHKPSLMLGILTDDELDEYEMGRQIGAIAPSRPQILHAGFEDVQPTQVIEAQPKRRGPGRPRKDAQPPQGSAVAAPEQSDVASPETADGATEASDAPTGPHFEPGHAQPGETYLMLGDAVSGLGRLPTYIDGKLYSSAGQEGAAKLKTYAQHPIATANAHAAETSQDSSGSATGASSGSAEETSSLDASKPSQHGASDPEVQDGFADPGDVYLMADTPAMADGRRAAFKDGAVVCAIDDWGLLPVYDEHPPADAEIVEGPQLPPAIATYADAVKAAADFKTVKFALSTLQKTPVWNGMTNDEADEVRFNTWDIMVNTGLADRLDPSADVSVFRLWLEWTEDPEEIEAMLSKLEDHPDFKGKGDNLKENIRGAAARRLEALSE